MDQDGIEILHSLTARGMEFVVCRDQEEGELFVARVPGGELSEFHVVPDISEPAVIEDDAWWACGGIAPPGAARATFRDNGGDDVTAAVSHGAWIAVLDADKGPIEPAVSYGDSCGAIVAISRPDRMTAVEPVPEPAGPCAACTCAIWELVRFVDDWDEEDECLRCVNCGHREQLIIDGGMVTVSNDPAVAEKIRADFRAGISSFSVTALAVENAASPGRLSGWGGGSPDHWTGVTITHGGHGDQTQIHVNTYMQPFDEPVLTTVRRQFANTLNAKRCEQDQEGDLAHETPALQAALREAERRAAEAPVVEIEATIDGASMTLLAVGTRELWSAIGALDDRTILISAQQWPMEGIALTGIDLSQFA